MTKCVLCGKARAENEMRPLINIDELAVGNALSDADEQEGVEGEREVGGATIQVVCRPCWHAILESKEKGDVIEMLETLCGLLFEVERRRADEKANQLRAIGNPNIGVPYRDPSVIEKGRKPLGQRIQSPQKWVLSPPHTIPCGTSGRPYPTSGLMTTGSGAWAIGGNTGGATTLSIDSMSNLGAQWDNKFGSAGDDDLAGAANRP